MTYMLKFDENSMCILKWLNGVGGESVTDSIFYRGVAIYCNPLNRLGRITSSGISLSLIDTQLHSP